MEEIREQVLWGRKSRDGQGGRKGRGKKQQVQKIKEKGDNGRMVADKEEVAKNYYSINENSKTKNLRPRQKKGGNRLAICYN